MARRPFYPNAEFRESFIGSLGSFINMFSQVEGMARSLMVHFAGVDAPTALALFSGVKIDQAIQNIRRLHTARKVTLDPALNKALEQMAVLTSFRNDLLHNRIDFAVTPPVTTNRAMVLNEGSVRETEIGPDTLRNAEDDLAVIVLVFTVFLSDTREAANLDWVLEEPWHHKSASQPRKRSQ